MCAGNIVRAEEPVNANLRRRAAMAPDWPQIAKHCLGRVAQALRAERSSTRQGTDENSFQSTKSQRH